MIVSIVWRAFCFYCGPQLVCYSVACRKARHGPVGSKGNGMKRILGAFAVLSLLVGSVGSAHAGLLGTQMTGSLTFGADPTNYFDPESGFVPAGYLNTNSIRTTVTVSNPAIEYGFSDGSTTITANFNDTDITINVEPLQGTTAPPFQMIFTTLDEFDSGYLTGSAQFFTFALGSTNSLGNPTTITATFAGGTLPFGVQIFTATETVAEPSPAPEPATLALLGIGVAGIGFSRRKH
jgi:hypothetical protein